MGFTTTVVEGQLFYASGAPAAGVAVTATLSEPIFNGGSGQSARTITSFTSATGAFQIALAANTDEGTTPDGSYYTIACVATGLELKVIVPPTRTPISVFALPQVANTANLATKAELEALKAEVEPGPWVDLDLNSEYAVSEGANYTPQIRREGAQARLRGVIELTKETPEEAVLATFPAEYNPYGLTNGVVALNQQEGEDGGLWVSALHGIQAAHVLGSGNELYLDGITWPLA